MSKYIYLASLLIAGLGFNDHSLAAADHPKSNKISFTSDEEGGAVEEAAPEEHHEVAPEEQHETVSEAPPVTTPEEEAAMDRTPEVVPTPETGPEATSSPQETPAKTPAEPTSEAPVETPEETSAAVTPSLSEVVQGEAEANKAAEEASNLEDKTLDNLQDLLKQAGENPTPEQKTQISKAANSYLSAATQSAQAEAKSTAAQEKVVTTRIRNNVSSNAPAEPGF